MSTAPSSRPSLSRGRLWEMEDAFLERSDIEARMKRVGLAMVLVSATSIAVLAVAFAFSAFLLLSGLVDEMPQPATMSKRTQVTIRLVLNLVFSTVSVFCLLSGLSMRRLRGYRRARLAAMFACIPCVSPCLVLGIPVGLWAFSMLQRPEVESAFDD